MIGLLISYNLPTHETHYKTSNNLRKITADSRFKSFEWAKKKCLQRTKCKYEHYENDMDFSMRIGIDEFPFISLIFLPRFLNIKYKMIYCEIWWKCIYSCHPQQNATNGIRNKSETKTVFDVFHSFRDANEKNIVHSFDAYVWGTVCDMCDRFIWVTLKHWLSVQMDWCESVFGYTLDVCTLCVFTEWESIQKKRHRSASIHITISVCSEQNKVKHCIMNQ